jgi:hypothetical protein
MATDKLFTVAGVSTLEGNMKVRFANDVMRVKVLAKHGHSDITLIELPEPMSKTAAAKFIQGLDEFQGVAEQATIADYLDRNGEKTAAPKAVKAAKAPKAVKAKAVATTADTSAMEDAPF